MADKFTSEQRHTCMSHVKNKNTKPEILVRKALFSKGFRYRINDRKIKGNPDIVLKKYHTAIFVNGCFWHGHKNCKKATIPETNTDFWREKIETNQRRDKETITALRNDGWKVIVVWECELSKKRLSDRIELLVEEIKQDSLQDTTI